MLLLIPSKPPIITIMEFLVLNACSDSMHRLHQADYKVSRAWKKIFLMRPMQCAKTCSQQQQFQECNDGNDWRLGRDQLSPRVKLSTLSTQSQM